MIAIPWLAIEHQRTIIPALELSSNNNELHIATRAALRPVLLPDDESAQIGTVDIAELAADLEALDKAAKELGTPPVALQNLESVPKQVSQIRKTINNLPKNDVAGFFRRGTKEPVTSAEVQLWLTRAFLDEEKRAMFVDQNNKPVTWDQLRYGPLDTIL